MSAVSVMAQTIVQTGLQCLPSDLWNFAIMYEQNGGAKQFAMLQLLLLEDHLTDSEREFLLKSWFVGQEWAICSPDGGSAQISVSIKGNEDNLLFSTLWKEPSDGRPYFFLIRFW